MLPTPPVAPVTRTGPRSGSSPRASRAIDAHRSGEASRPDRHRLTGREAGRERHDPLRRDPLVRCEAAVTADPEVVPVGDDGVARPDRGVVARHDDAGEIDAGDERTDPGDLAVRDRRQRILVVDARPLDGHQDLAGREVGRGEVLDTPTDVVAVSLRDVGGEGRRERAVGHRPVIVGAAPGAARKGRSPRRPSAPSSPTTDRAARPLRGGGAPAQWTDVRPRAPARWMDVG